MGSSEKPNQCGLTPEGFNQQQANILRKMLGSVIVFGSGLERSDRRPYGPGLEAKGISSGLSRARDAFRQANDGINLDENPSTIYSIFGSRKGLTEALKERETRIREDEDAVEPIEEVCCIFNEGSAILDELRGRGVKVKTLFHFHDVIEFYKREKLIDDNQYDQATNYLSWIHFHEDFSEQI